MRIDGRTKPLHQCIFGLAPQIAGCGIIPTTQYFKRIGWLQLPNRIHKQRLGLMCSPFGRTVKAQNQLIYPLRLTQTAPGPALGAPSRGCRLPDAVLHGKRSHSASQQGRPAPFGHWISSEAFQLAWAGGCATGPQTRSRHDCVCGPRLDHLARGLPPLLAVRSPRATGLASSLSGCVWLTGQRCRL